MTVTPEANPHRETALGDCGRELSQLDPDSVNVPLAPWGDSVHDVVSPPRAQEHREFVEELADEQGFEPVAEIPTDALDSDQVLSLDVDASSDEVAVMNFSDSETFRVAGVDLATGDALWAWSVDHPHSAATKLHNQGEHLVVAHAIPPSDTPDGTFAVELVSVDLSTGKQTGCKRFGSDSRFFTSQFGYLVNSDSTGILTTREAILRPGEEKDTYGRNLRPVEVPGFSSEVSTFFPNQAYLDGKTEVPGRWQAIAAIDEDVYIAYAYGFYQDALVAAGSPSYEFDQDSVPVRAFSVESGEQIWEIGEPGDQIAFISTVPNAFDGAPGLLTAEIGEFHRADNGPGGDSSVTLQMYDLHGNLVWERTGQDSQDFTGGDVAVLDDLILLQIATDDITAVDAGTGEELWTAGVTDGDDYPLPLDDVKVFGDSLFMPGFDVRHLIDPETGEQHDPSTEEAIRDAGVNDITELGEEHLVLHSGNLGDALVRAK